MAKKPTPLESIERHPRYAAPAAILRTLTEGMQQIEQETDALRIEEYLGSTAAVLQGKDSLRTKDLQERVRKYRSRALPRKDPEPTVEPSLSRSVAAALELLRVGTRPARHDNKAVIAQLQEDYGIVHTAFLEQHALVENIRNALVAEQSLSDREPWAAIQLRKFRALQAVAAIKDEEDDFRKSRIDAGFTPWRSDLLPTIASRPVLVLGTERDWDSEISRARRLLEEQKLI